MQDALKSSKNLSPYDRKMLKAEYDNKNLARNIKLTTSDNINKSSTVYLDYHNGNDPKEAKRHFDENKRRSIFYKERVLNHKAPLGLDNDPIHLKFSEKGQSYTKYDDADKHFIHAIKQQKDNKK
jgi:hypothetical protein